MILTSEVVKQECCGYEARITLSNAKRKHGGLFLDYNPSIDINIPLSMLRSYPIGRTVIIEIKPK